MYKFTLFSQNLRHAKKTGYTVLLNSNKPVFMTHQNGDILKVTVIKIFIGLKNKKCIELTLIIYMHVW
jgi:hypothetical protein